MSRALEYGLAGRGQKRAALAALLCASCCAAAQSNAARAKTHPAVTPPTAAQIHFIPEVLNAFAGGTNTARAADDGTTDNIAAASAGLGLPEAIAIDSQGNVYEADRQAKVVRKIIAASGKIVTVAGIPQPLPPVFGGSGSPTSSRSGSKVAPALAAPGTQVALAGPAGLAVGPDDTLYIADSDAQVVYHLDSAGNLTPIAGTLNMQGFSASGTLATNALLNEPQGLAVDAAGNVFIADTFNNLIREIKAVDGTLVTIAGNEDLAAGYEGDGGPALAARLNNPQGLAIDLAGNLLIADSSNAVVRRVDLGSGNISAFAGNNIYGTAGDGGSALAAQLKAPWSLAVDAAGDVYIADNGAHVVRRVAPDGTISTVAGIADSVVFLYPGYGKPSTASSLGVVQGVAVDASGALYISTISYGAILKTGPGALLDFGSVTTRTSASQTLVVENTGAAAVMLGSPAFAPQDPAMALSLPAIGACADGATLAPGTHCAITVTFSPVAAGSFASTILLSDSAGDSPQTVRVIGMGVLPASAIALTVMPTNAFVGNPVAFTATVTSASGTGPVPTGTVTFKNARDHSILATAAVDSSTGIASASISTLPGGLYSIEADYSGDASYAPSTSLPVQLNIDRAPVTVNVSASPTTANAGDAITAQATVQASGDVPDGMVQFNVDGLTVATAQLASGVASASFTAPGGTSHGVQAIYSGSATYAPGSSNLVQLLTHGGLLVLLPGSTTTVAGVPGTPYQGYYTGDGPATSEYLHTPSAAAVDAVGNLYFTDEGNNIVRKVSPDGQMTTVAGVQYDASVSGYQFDGDGGVATSAHLAAPSSVAIDSAGDLYIADTQNSVVRKVTPDGIIHTVIGKGQMPGHNADQSYAPTVQLSYPKGVAVDAAGNLYVADTGNNLVRKIDPALSQYPIAGKYIASSPAPQNGVATDVALKSPTGLAVGPDGSVYIADTGYNVVQKVDASGNITIVAGGGSTIADEVYGTQAQLDQPGQMAIDAAGALYFTEAGRGVVRRLDPALQLSTAVGYVRPWASGTFFYLQPSGEPADQFLLQGGTGVAVDGSGSLYVTDNDNQTVLRVGPYGALYFTADNGHGAQQSLRLENRGDQPVQFGSPLWSIEGDYDVSDGVNTNCVFTPMAPGASCHLLASNFGTIGTGSVTIATKERPGIADFTTLTDGIQTTTLLSTSSFTANIGDTVQFNANVIAGAKVPEGRVSFIDNLTTKGTIPLADGAATLSFPMDHAGVHSVLASYQPNSAWTASVSNTVTIDVSGYPTKTVVTATPSPTQIGNETMLHAVVTKQSDGQPATTGEVRFFDATASLVLADVPIAADGTATASVALPVGTYSIAAAFDGAGDFASSASTSISLAVSNSAGTNDAGYTLEYSGLPAEIFPGATATATVVVQQLGYIGPVTLTCGTLPSYATCTFTPSVLQLSGEGPAPAATLTITTSASPQGAAVMRPVRFEQAGPHGELTVSGGSQ